MDRELRKDALKDQAKGRIEEVKGKVRGDIGDALDDRDQHLKGRVEETKGKLRRKVGEIKEDLADADDSDRI